LGCKIPIACIPFGIHLSDYKPDTQHTEFPSLFHLGSMDWMPNEEAIKWFLKNCWPKIHVKYADLNLYLAGRNMPDWLQQLKMKNVVILGEIKDPLTFINSKS